MSEDPLVEVTFANVPLSRLSELMDLVRPLQTRWRVVVVYRLQKEQA